MRGAKPRQAGGFGVGACPPMIANKGWVRDYVLVKLLNVWVAKIFIYGLGFKLRLLGYILLVTSWLLSTGQLVLACSKAKVHAYTTNIVHGCTIALLDACTMAKAHALTIGEVYAYGIA